MLRGWRSFMEFWRGAGVAPAASRGVWGANTSRMPAQVLPHDPGQGAPQLLGAENEGEAGEEAGPGIGTAAGGNKAEGERGNEARELGNSCLSQAPSRVSSLFLGIRAVAESRKRAAGMENSLSWCQIQSLTVTCSKSLTRNKLSGSIPASPGVEKLLE